MRFFLKIIREDKTMIQRSYSLQDTAASCQHLLGSNMAWFTCNKSAISFLDSSMMRRKLKSIKTENPFSKISNRDELS